MFVSKAPASPAVPVDGLFGHARVEAIVALSASIGLATLDSAIVNTALPTIARDLGTDAASAIWVVTSYQIAVVAALLPLAALGDIIGHRRIYLVGQFLFVVTSLACGLAWSLPTLVAARALQGFGGAAIMAANTASCAIPTPSRSSARASAVIPSSSPFASPLARPSPPASSGSRPGIGCS